MSRCLCGHDEFEHEDASWLLCSDEDLRSIKLCLVMSCDCEAFEWDHMTEEENDDE